MDINDELRQKTQRAAEGGDGNAQIRLAMRLLMVDKDFPESFRWFQRAAQQGLSDGQYGVGMAYHMGLGIDRDPSQAAHWLRLAADQGNWDALRDLLEVFGDDPTVVGPGDRRRWHLCAAASGIPVAQNNYALMLDSGDDGPVDQPEARVWFIKAAEEGDLSAMGNIGIMYYYGQGGPVDLVQAREWYRRGAE